MTHIQEPIISQQQDDFTRPDETVAPDRNDRSAVTVTDENVNIPVSFSRTVPHGALHAEREEHKKTRAALAQLRTQHAQMLNEIGQAHENDLGNHGEKEFEKSKDMPPDPAQDFLNFTRWQAGQLAHQRQQAQASKLWQDWQQSCQDCKNELPDLDSAVAFLAEMRERQLTALGSIDTHFQDENNRHQQLQAEWQELVRASLARGDNPATTLYQLAQAHGYGNDRVDTPTRLKTLDEAQKAARTLTASHGRQVGDAMLLENLANLSEAEFARWYENNPDSFRQLFAD